MELVHGSGNIFRNLGRPPPEARELKAILAGQVLKNLGSAAAKPKSWPGSTMAIFPVCGGRSSTVLSMLFDASESQHGRYPLERIEERGAVSLDSRRFCR